MPSVDDVQSHASAIDSPLSEARSQAASAVEQAGEAAVGIDAARQAAEELAQASQVLGYGQESERAEAVRSHLEDLHGRVTGATGRIETGAGTLAEAIDKLTEIQTEIEQLRGLLRGSGDSGSSLQVPRPAAPRLDLSDPAFDERKLTGYALNPDHPVGGNKAKVIESRTGFGLADAAEVKRQILAKASECEAVPGKTDKHGTRWHVDVPLTGPRGTMTIRTGWITDSQGARLVTISFPPKGES